ncbi:MAG: hypothetical protein N2379_00495 [Verrucomicrobiae bacterium]|nr:hypothetical protein [Verrucomicrobiae bacterium]
MISPDVAVNDYFGFAYLLSSLIALKMHSKHIVLRLTRATLQTSFVAAVAANLLGLWLATLLGSVPVGVQRQPGAAAPLKASGETLESIVAREKLRLYAKRAPESSVMPTPSELNRFREALQLIQQYMETGSREQLELARAYLERLNYAVELVRPAHLCLYEKGAHRGWGFYVIDLSRRHGLLVEVPAPLDEWGVVESGLRLYLRLDASAVAVAGSARFANKDGSSDVLANRNTPFHVFHQVFGRRNVLQVRGSTIEAVRQMPVLASSNMLFVKAELPRSLSLRVLQAEIGGFGLQWSPLQLRNLQQRSTRAGFAELWLARPTRIALKARLVEHILDTRARAVPSETLLPEWLLDQKRAIARGGTCAYMPPLAEELRFFDEEILTPLIEIAETWRGPEGFTAEAAQLLRAVECAAWQVGYQVCTVRDTSSGQEFLVLAEAPDQYPKRYWGTFVLRLGDRQPYIVQVPRPLFDLNTLEFGVHLFDRLKAEALLIAGSHNEANPDQVSDVLHFRNPTNLFSLVNQVVLRQAHSRAKMVLQCRGFAVETEGSNPPEIMVALADGIRNKETLGPLAKQMWESLEADGFRLQFVDGSPVTAGYEVFCVPQAYYINQSMNKEFAILWLSPVLRDAFRPQEEYPLRVQLGAAGIPIVQGSLKEHVARCLGSGRKTVIPDELRGLLLRYVRTMDVVLLLKARAEWPEFVYSALFDRGTKQLFLLISGEAGAAPVVLNLRPRHVQTEITGDELERLERYLSARAPLLEWPQ